MMCLFMNTSVSYLSAFVYSLQYMLPAHNGLDILVEPPSEWKSDL